MENWKHEKLMPHVMLLHAKEKNEFELGKFKREEITVNVMLQKLNLGLETWKAEKLMMLLHA